MQHSPPQNIPQKPACISFPSHLFHGNSGLPFQQLLPETMSSMTHSNPLVQGGWDSELAMSHFYDPYCESGTTSPTSSETSSSSSSSSVPSFDPAPSSYGALSTATPGAPASSFGEMYVVYCFVRLGDKMAVVRGSELQYMFENNFSRVLICDNLDKPAARITWQASGALVERNGMQMKMSDIMRPMPEFK